MVIVKKSHIVGDAIDDGEIVAGLQLGGKPVKAKKKQSGITSGTRAIKIGTLACNLFLLRENQLNGGLVTNVTAQNRVFCFRAWISPDAWLLWQQKLINDGENGLSLSEKIIKIGQVETFLRVF